MRGYRQDLKDIPEVSETSTADESPYERRDAAPPGAATATSNQFDGGNSIRETTRGGPHHQGHQNGHFTPADTWSQRRLVLAYIRLVFNPSMRYLLEI
jgi:hypothetical protein